MHVVDWSTRQTRPTSWAPPDFPLSAETTIVLPVTADALFLVSRGSYQSGSVALRQGTERDIRLDIRVAYHNERALARATIRRLSEDGNKHGVSIDTPVTSPSHPHDRLYCEVVFTFPAPPSDHSPRRIKAFTTHTANFAHQLGDLWRTLQFDHLRLDTANAHIRAESITLTKGSLISSNGAIIGHFNVSDALVLRTSNARIQATASLFSTHRDATQLEMRTSNGAITSSVSLTTTSGSGGNFVVTARTSNGPIDLRYDDAPTGARLVSDARTSNAGATVAMHPAYEGTYDVTTSNSRPVVRDTHPEDPQGQGRRRVVEQQAANSRHVRGRVYWEGSRTVHGTSTIHTSNARASLAL